MMPSDICISLIRIKRQIDHLKQQLEAAPNNKRLQHQLKEFQTLQLWQLSQAENGQDPDAVALAAALSEHDEAIRLALERADRVRAYLAAGDVEGLRRFVEAERRDGGE